MKYVLGIDLGGGASKACLMSENGDVITSTAEYPTYYPKQGYIEQDPGCWYDAVIKNIGEILTKTLLPAKNIVCVCIDAATHTAVLCDENYKPLCNSIYWTDTRSVKEVSFLKEEYSELILRQALHSPSTIWTLPQLLWIKNNRPDIFGRIKKILFTKDYIRHLLTGDYVTDYIEAQGSMLFDNTAMTWSEELCDILQIDLSSLPQLVKPSDIAGYVTKSAAIDTGLAEGTPVICGSTDTVMEILASGAIRTGEMTVKLATAGRICVITDRAYTHEHLINYFHVIDGLWYPGTATKSCAASYRWYRDTFGSDYKTLDIEAEIIPAGSEGLLYHPYLNGELTPYADPKLCGSFTGIKSLHTKGHFNRAVLEGVAYSLLECKNLLDEIGIEYNKSAIIIGGGSKSVLWRQIIADVLNLELVCKDFSDSSIGSAVMAGCSVGMFESFDEALKKSTKVISRIEPDINKNKLYNEYFNIYKKVHDALAPVYDLL